ncbi:MAG TPA: LLM class F420-dependent oxidoreductase [Acidimicrobiales bacterium]|nr:LLM class F420-dependent oxidoreductase [Acidimicrobiales bacterium]
MRFSVWPNPAQPWEGVLDEARHAEATGWDGIWYADHFMPNGPVEEPATTGPMNECWAVMAGLAAVTTRLRIGSLVCGNTYRHPAVLAKQAATVDLLSGGRLVLGLGAGWQENEHRAYGIDFFDVRTRMDMLEEACQVVKGLLTQERTDFQGKHYQLTDAPLAPKPAQDPLPLLIGGGGEKRTMRIAARYADEWNVWGAPDRLRQKIEVLDRHCEDLGRDPKSIQRSAQALVFMTTDEAKLKEVRDMEIPTPHIAGTPAEITEVMGEYRDAGVDEFIFPDFTLGEDRNDVFDLFQAEVAPAVR